MATSRFDSWKYQHPGPGIRPRWQRPLGWLLLLASLFALKTPPVAVVLFLLGLVALLFSRKRILIGSRYLICGPEIVYFANVERLDHDDLAGVLRLTLPGRPDFVLLRDNFPTNARKANKILYNRTLKFTKVTSNIIERVKANNPAAAIDVKY